MEQANENQQQVTVNVDAGVAFTLKLQEFDKAIAQAEAQVANLKMQKASYVYDTNLNNVVAQAQQKDSAQAAQPVKQEPIPGVPE